MEETADQRQRREDARVLGQIGEILARADLPGWTVRLPSPLADAARNAWERDDKGPLATETFEQYVIRSYAGTLGLIGLAIEESGRVDGKDVLVELHPHAIGHAIEASDLLE